MRSVPPIPKLHSRTALGFGILTFFFCVFDHVFEFDGGFIPNAEEAGVTTKPDIRAQDIRAQRRKSANCANIFGASEITLID